MNTKVQSIVDQALSFSSQDRIAVAEMLLSSLDSPDPAIDAVWKGEVEERVDAYERGELEAISAKQVFSEYEMQ